MGKSWKLTMGLFALVAVLTLSGSVQAAAVEGVTSGVFQNPVYEVNGAPFGVGIGTNSFAWGDPVTAKSSLTFTGTTFAADFGEVFSVGTLDFFNGSIEKLTGASEVELVGTMVFTAPTGAVESVTADFQLINSFDTDDPVESADSVFVAAPVPDIQFMAGDTIYTLEFLGFGDVTEGGFTTFDRFFVYENEGASAELLARMTEEVVPVSPSVVLALVGSIGSFLFHKRRTINF